MYIDLLCCETHKMMIFGKMYFIPNILQNIFLCFTEGKSYSFGMTWGWVNDSRIFIFGWNIHLSCYLLKIQYGQFYDTFMILLCKRVTSIIFQTFSFVQLRTESIQVWNNIKVNKWWQFLAELFLSKPNWHLFTVLLRNWHEDWPAHLK